MKLQQIGLLLEAKTKFEDILIGQMRHVVYEYLNIHTKYAKYPYTITRCDRSKDTVKDVIKLLVTHSSGDEVVFKVYVEQSVSSYNQYFIMIHGNTIETKHYNFVFTFLDHLFKDGFDRFIESTTGVKVSKMTDPGHSKKSSMWLGVTIDSKLTKKQQYDELENQIRRDIVDLVTKVNMEYWFHEADVTFITRKGEKVLYWAPITNPHPNLKFLQFEQALYDAFDNFKYGYLEDCKIVDNIPTRYGKEPDEDTKYLKLVIHLKDIGEYDEHQ